MSSSHSQSTSTELLELNLVQILLAELVALILRDSGPVGDGVIVVDVRQHQSLEASDLVAMLVECHVRISWIIGWHSQAVNSRLGHRDETVDVVDTNLVGPLNHTAISRLPKHVTITWLKAAFFSARVRGIMGPCETDRPVGTRHESTTIF
jgi:hypothetical protein